jgi:hypothetical protein
MNKNQGTTIGAILLAALLLRPLGGNNPSAPVEPKPENATAANTLPQSNPYVGPWIASCKY